MSVYLTVCAVLIIAGSTYNAMAEMSLGRPRRAALWMAAATCVAIFQVLGGKS
jgi:hypothetical protein